MYYELILSDIIDAAPEADPELPRLKDVYYNEDDMLRGLAHLLLERLPGAIAVSPSALQSIGDAILKREADRMVFLFNQYLGKSETVRVKVLSQPPLNHYGKLQWSIIDRRIKALLK